MPPPQLRSVVSGNANGPTLLFIHGWPDDSSLFDSMVNQLDKSFYCVRVTLPNFGPPGTDNPIKRSGYTFESIVAALISLVIDVQTRRSRPQEPVSLVLHDWGCVYGFMLERSHPELVKNVVSMDIGTHFRPTIFEIIFIIMYQSYILLAWLLGFIYAPLGDALVRAMCRAGKTPTPERTTSAMGYPYFYFWKLLLTRSALLRPDSRGLCPFPCLYLYGRQKPMRFHSDAFLFAISKRADSRTEAFDADHWFFTRSQHSEIANAMIEKWLKERYNM